MNQAAEIDLLQKKKKKTTTTKQTNKQTNKHQPLTKIKKMNLELVSIIQLQIEKPTQFE